MAGKAVVIHAPAHADAALAAADRLGVPVVLLSAPGAATYVGPAWFLEMLASARSAHPGVHAVAVLDCGERPGDVLAALRAGVTGVVFTGRSEVADKLAALAAAHGARVLRHRPPARDLLDVDDPEAACREWLSRP